MDTRPVVELEEGWAIIQLGITNLINNLEAGSPNNKAPMGTDCYMQSYSTVYNLCSQKPPHSYIEEVYERYEGVYSDYLNSKVLPAIQEKNDHVPMLQELVKRWANHKVMVRTLSAIFFCLDRYYIPNRKLPSLKDVGFGCFGKIVGMEMKVRVKDAVISLINQERQGGEIDQSLVKNVVQIFVDLQNIPIGSTTHSPSLEYYVKNFETSFLNDTADYYTRKASTWNKKDCEVKAKECLQKEKDRVSHYLHSSTEEKLLKVVQDVLKTLLEKESL